MPPDHGHAARVERVVEAPIARVWQALIDPRELAAWYWPPSFGTEVELEPVAGGSFRIVSARVGMAAVGRVVAAEAPRLLELAWRWEGEELETSVMVELAAESPDRTRVSIVHAGFLTEDAASDHATGWTDCLARLPGYLAG
jgi:uncharacterized protein YndB with AHSA1/START domain